MLFPGLDSHPSTRWTSRELYIILCTHPYLHGRESSLVPRRFLGRMFVNCLLLHKVGMPVWRKLPGSYKWSGNEASEDLEWDPWKLSSDRESRCSYLCCVKKCFNKFVNDFVVRGVVSIIRRDLLLLWRTNRKTALIKMSWWTMYSML